MGTVDKRLQVRLVREGLASDAVIREEAEQLPDLSGNIRRLDDAELGAFRKEIASEKEVRAESIVRALERAVAPPPPPPQPVQGFDEEDL